MFYYLLADMGSFVKSLGLDAKSSTEPVKPWLCMERQCLKSPALAQRMLLGALVLYFKNPVEKRNSQDLEGWVE